MIRTDRAIVVCLLLGGRDTLPRKEILQVAELMGVTERTVYRYLEHIGKAKFILKQLQTNTLQNYD